MRSLLAGPSIVRQLPSSHGVLTASFSTSTVRLRPTEAVRTSVSQVSSDSFEEVSEPTPSSVVLLSKRGRNAKQALDTDPNKLAAPPMFRRERRLIEKKARAEEKEKRKIENSPLARAGFEEVQRSPYVRIDQGFKTFKPITPSLRWVRYAVQPHLHKGRPLRALTEAKRGTGGRNHHGHVVVRGRGGGHKRRIRLVDFHRWETGPQTVIRIEYDPGRSAHIALIEHDLTKIKSYILAPDGMREGGKVQSYRLDKDAIDRGTGRSGTALDMGIFRTKAIRSGNVLPLRAIPVGTVIHAVSLQPNGKAQLIRSAGSHGQITAFVHKKKSKVEPESISAKDAASAADVSAPAAVMPGLEMSDAGAEVDAESDWTPKKKNVEPGGGTSTHAQVRMQSGEVRLIASDCCATIGRVSNSAHRLERIGKAGRSRWMGRRPKVRGVAMNATDHPHGGGRGKSKGNKHPRSIWGWKTKGPRTRKPGTRRGNKMVVHERPRGKAKLLA